MDKKQAQFILHSFRPDGADAMDEDFAEALQLAVEDRALGEWLADERASDAAFAAALCEVEIPDELRMHTLSVMRGEKPTVPAQDAEMDAFVCGALAHVESPEGLRDQILAAMHIQSAQGNADASDVLENVAAMDVGAHSPDEPVSPVRSRFGWFQIASLAATVVFGGFLALQVDLGEKSITTSVAGVRDVGGVTSGNETRLTSYDLQREAGRMLNSKLALDVMNSQQGKVNSWLADHELPVPARLPVGLRGMKIIGCKKILLPGDMSASLLCFTKDSGCMVHLVVINNDYIRDAHLPGMDEIKKGDCYLCPKSGWNIARWRDRENTFLLFAKKEAASGGGLLEYF